MIFVLAARHDDDDDDDVNPSRIILWLELKELRILYVYIYICVSSYPKVFLSNVYDSPTDLFD